MNSWAAIWASVRPWATRVTSSRSRALSRPSPVPVAAASGPGAGAVSRRAYSAAVDQLIAAPRFSADCVRAGPSDCRASSRSSCRRRTTDGGLADPSYGNSASLAAHTVMASAQRPVAAHRYPQQARLLASPNQPPGPALIWSASRRCAVAPAVRPDRISSIAIPTSRAARFRRSPTSRDRASPAEKTRSASARSPDTCSTSARKVLQFLAIQPGISAGICSACRASRTDPSRSPE